jgi:hypothetical protein
MATLDEKDIESVGAGEGRAATQSSTAYVNDEVTDFKDFTDDIKRIVEAKLQNREVKIELKLKKIIK